GPPPSVSTSTPARAALSHRKLNPRTATKAPNLQLDAGPIHAYDVPALTRLVGWSGILTHRPGASRLAQAAAAAVSNNFAKKRMDIMSPEAAVAYGLGCLFHCQRYGLALSSHGSSSAGP